MASVKERERAVAGDDVGSYKDRSAASIGAVTPE
jgi:hypothetical protein